MTNQEAAALASNEAAARAAIMESPENGQGWKRLGIVLQIREQYPEAVLMLQKAVAMLPADGEACVALGYALEASRQLEAADACFDRAIALAPDSYLAHRGKAATLAMRRRFAEAEKSYVRAIELQPQDPNVVADYGRLLNALRRPVEAEARARDALRLQADNHTALNVLGNALLALNRADEAVLAARQAVALKEDDACYHNDLGGALVTAALLDEAERHIRRSLELDPGMAVAWLNLGVLMLNTGRFAAASTCFRKTIELDPGYTEAHGMLGVSLQFENRLAEAEAALRKTLALDPGNADAHNNLGGIYLTQGRLEEAARYYEKALELKPALCQAHSNVLFCHSHDERIGPEQLFREHVLFGERFETPLKAEWPVHANDRDPDRPLRVGFVSADLRSHAVAYFIEPILERLAAGDRIVAYVYSNSEMEDEFTERLRKHAAQWRKVTGDSDPRLCQRIREDRIDILIDLSGHTGKYRLTAFARKPAPVQASWIGYPGTTGLTAMDYYFADRHFLPPGKFDDQFTEKIVHLPAVVPFRPHEGAPDVSELPALANGYVTFGSFNRLSKVTDSTLHHWSGLLRALPKSRMLIAGMPAGEGYKDPRLILRDNGVDAERVTLHPRSDMGAYLRLHHGVDICLDTFPYSGGTTTLHALWMGVPTLSVAGPTPAGRGGAAIMLPLGLSAYVARDSEDFVKRGRRIAKDLEGLAKLRGELRSRMRASVLGRPDKVAAGLEKALRIMWQRWCAGLPPESFEVR